MVNHISRPLYFAFLPGTKGIRLNTSYSVPLKPPAFKRRTTLETFEGCPAREKACLVVVTAAGLLCAQSKAPLTPFHHGFIR